MSRRLYLPQGQQYEHQQSTPHRAGFCIQAGDNVQAGLFNALSIDPKRRIRPICDRAMFGDMVYGQAYKPFVYRTLLPSMVRGITWLIPPATRAFMSRIDWLFRDWEQGLLTEYLVAFLLMCAALVGVPFAMKYLFTGLFRAPAKFIDLVSLAALACLPFFFRYYSYIYNFPTLLLFTLGLGLMVRRRWRAYLVLYAVACLNKETTILLTLIFALYYLGRQALLTPRFYIRLLLAQLGIFLLVRAGLVWAFRDNPGSALEFHLLDHNLHQLSQLYCPVCGAWHSCPHRL